MFSDEVRLCLRHTDRRRRVYRRIGEEHADACVERVTAFGGGSIMVWGGISLRGKTQLVVVDGNLNSERYINQILSPHVVPFAQRIGDDFVFQQDNARPHTAQATANYLHAEGVQVMAWPACSPDLNPIEQLWDQLKRAVYRRMDGQSTMADLRRVILEEWDRIPNFRVVNLIRSMRRRTADCFQANGGYIRY